ncbi:MAG: HPr kinase/phosphorylase [Alphaproteobacteria bacterium]
MAASSTKIHASCVEFAGAAVLLRAGSGAGKSDLALRLIDGPHLDGPHLDGANCGAPTLGQARLVADDQVCLTRQGEGILASAPAVTAGKLEIRGLGIVEVASTPEARLALVVDLADQAAIPRMPEEAAMQVTILGVSVARIQIDPGAASAPARIRAALGHFQAKLQD